MEFVGPFSQAEVLVCEELVVREDFPTTDFVDKLRLLDSPVPIASYIVAAGRALQILRSNSPESMILTAQSGASIVDRIEDWVNSHSIAGTTGAKPSCRSGCFFCCFLQVNVLEPEVQAITQHISAALPPETQSEIRRHLQVHLSSLILASPEDQTLRPKLCPLNINGLCSIYAVRPMACRRHHSYSLDHCRIAFEEWDKGHSIPLNTLRVRCSDAVIQATMDALAHVGMSPDIWELPVALSSFIG